MTVDKPIAFVTLDTVLDRLLMIMLEVVSKLCVGDIFLTSEVFTWSQSSGTWQQKIQQNCFNQHLNQSIKFIWCHVKLKVKKVPIVSIALSQICDLSIAAHLRLCDPKPRRNS